MMQVQATRQREEIQSMERRLKNEFFSHVDSSAEATRPASSSLPVISSVESDVNECMHGANEAFVRSGPRFDGSFCSIKVSNPPAETEVLACADATASEIGYNTYLTQPPPVAGMAPGAANALQFWVWMRHQSLLRWSVSSRGTRPERLWMLGATRCEVQGNKNKKNNQMMW